MSIAQFVIPTLVTLTDIANPLRPMRGGMVIGQGRDPGSYNVLLYADGQQKEAVPAVILQGIIADDGAPLRDGEKWRITAITGTGDLSKTISDMLQRILLLEHGREQYEKQHSNALSMVNKRLKAVIETLMTAVNDDDLIERVMKSFETGVVVHKPKDQTELVETGASARKAQ